MDSRVFVVNEPMRHEGGHFQRFLNLDRAKVHGPLVHVLPAGSLPDDMEFVCARIKERMVDFGPSDLLMLIGDPRAQAVASVIAARACCGKLRLLQWQRGINRYDVVTVDTTI